MEEQENTEIQVKEENNEINEIEILKTSYNSLKSDFDKLLNDINSVKNENVKLRNDLDKANKIFLSQQVKNEEEKTYDTLKGDIK